MSNELKAYFATAEAISKLFYPHVEVLIHDLKTHKIAAIYNPISKREVGDDSLLEPMFESKEDIIGPYEKTNWNGNRIKAITSQLRNKEGKAIGLMCINFDLTWLVQMESQISPWLKQISSITQHENLFAEDWRERINRYIHQLIQEKGWNLATLSSAQKSYLIERLYHVGAFTGRYAAQYAADIIGISRATVYNYLKNITIV